MQVKEVRRGMFEAAGHNVVVITPDGANPEREHEPLAVSFPKGSTTVTLRTNCRSDSSAHLIGIAAIRHIHEALGEVLRRMELNEAGRRPCIHSGSAVTNRD